MANFFDIYDEPAAAPVPAASPGNFFDRFDQPAAPPQWSLEQQKALALAAARQRSAAAAVVASKWDAFPIVEPAPAAPQKNFFDRFDPPAADPWAKFPVVQAAPLPGNNPGNPMLRQADGGAPEPGNPWLDSAAGLGSGLVRGAAETAMLPVTIDRLGQAGVGWGMDRGEDLIRSIMGQPPVTDAERAQRQQTVEQTTNPLDKMLNSGQDFVRGQMDEHLYKPQTTPGHFAETIGEFLVPGGMPSKATRLASSGARKFGEYVADLAKNAVVPGAASEAAGQVTQGTPLEPFARVAGGLGGNLAMAGAAAMNAPESVLRRAVGDPGQIDWEKALQLQNNPTGIRLTGPEAISQAQDGGTALTNLQRVIEGSIEGQAIMSPFFAARPGQVDTAVNNVLDHIAPQSPTPSVLGPRVAQAAEGAISASPEGQALAEAIFGAGPRTTPMQAGDVIQPALRNVFDHREGMRNALGDADYAAARAAQPSVPVADMQPLQTTTQPAYTSIQPVVPEGAPQGAPAQMTPQAVPAQVQTPALTSSTGPAFVQVDARPVVQFIDGLIPNARATSADALRTVRGMLFDRGGVDTGVNGLDAARGQIGDMITTARQNGQMQTVDLLGQVQRQLDQSLRSVPEYNAARTGFQAASVPLAPFESPGMAKSIQRDEFNQNFSTPSEQIAALLSTPSEAQNFNAVAPTNAQTAMQNTVATNMLDKATDAAGNVSGEKLALVLRENADLLTQFPQVAERLQSIVGASGNMSRARIGPIGEIAAAKDTAAAGNAMLHHNPMVGSEGESADAIARLVMQDADSTKGAVRQNLADRYSKASTETQQGDATFGGAKYHKDIAGNAQREATLSAVLDALNAPEAAQGMDYLREALQATGRRKQIGSATEFNRTINADLGANSPKAAVMTFVKALGTSLPTQITDAAKRIAQRNSSATLAQMFTDPYSVELISQAMTRGPTLGLLGAVSRTGAQAGTVFGHQ